MPLQKPDVMINPPQLNLVRQNNLLLVTCVILILVQIQSFSNVGLLVVMFSLISLLISLNQILSFYICDYVTEIETIGVIGII